MRPPSAALSTVCSYHHERSGVWVAHDGIEIFKGEARFGGNLLPAYFRLLRHLACGSKQGRAF